MNLQTPGALSQVNAYDPTGGFRAGQSLMGTFSLPGAGGPATAQLPNPGAAPVGVIPGGHSPALRAPDTPPPGTPGLSPMPAGLAPSNPGMPGVMGPTPDFTPQANPALTPGAPAGALTQLQPGGRPSDEQIRAFYLANASNPSAIFSAMQEYGVTLADIQRALGAPNPANMAAMQAANQPGALTTLSADPYQPQLPMANRTPVQLDTSMYDPTNPFYDPYSIAGHPSTDQLLAAQRSAALLNNHQQHTDAMNNIDAAYEAKKQAAVAQANSGLRDQMQSSHGLRDAELARVTNLMRQRGFSDGQMQQFLNQINEQYNAQLANNGGYLSSFQYAAPDWFDSMTP